MHSNHCLSRITSATEAEDPAVRGGGGKGERGFQPIPVTAYVTMISINDSCVTFSRQLQVNASSPAVPTTNMSISNAASAAAVAALTALLRLLGMWPLGTAPLTQMSSVHSLFPLSPTRVVSHEKHFCSVLCYVCENSACTVTVLCTLNAKLTVNKGRAVRSALQRNLKVSCDTSLSYSHTCNIPMGNPTRQSGNSPRNIASLSSALEHGRVLLRLAICVGLLAGCSVGLPIPVWTLFELAILQGLFGSVLCVGSPGNVLCRVIRLS